MLGAHLGQRGNSVRLPKDQEDLGKSVGFERSTIYLYREYL